ncbi:MAG: hypothetical protein J6P54_07395 [Bacteroidales bacterium]|nr:hypothetical protein [Bacteroidales bacterium]
MKKISLISLFLLLICGMMAQAPEKFSYQAVVRDASNQLINSHAVGVRVSVLQGAASGNPVYVETHTVTTNANGLMTLEIGAGSVQQGTFTDIDWANGPYFLKTETDPNGGTNYSVTSSQQLLSVPYALFAKEASNAFSGDYNDLTNTPAIPTVPTNVSAFTNDAGYLTGYTETDPTVPAWAKEANKPTYNYSEITNTPTIPTVPNNVSAFTNDAGYLIEETQTLSDVTAIGNSAGSRQLKDVSDPTEAYDAVNLRTLTLLMDSLRNDFQQQLQQLQQQMQQQIDSLQEIVSALDTNHHTDDFVCGTSTLTDYEGNVYATVQIGNQCWMRDNLRTTHYADGTAIPLDSSYTNSAEPCYYDYSSSAIPLTQRGYLYNWPAVMRGASSSNTNPSGVQGICPTGWHVPSDAEWTQLTDYVSSQSDYLCMNNTENIAKALSSTTGWSSSSSTCAVGNNMDLNNSTSFSAMPAGYRYNLGFTNSGKYAYFWSSTEASLGNSWYRSFNYNYAYVYRNNYGKHLGYSVRCLRDETEGSSDSTQISLPTVTTDSVTAITTTSATLNGTISNPDNVTITAQGFEWKVTEGGNYTTVDASGETMSYNLTGLTANTGYSYRAFVTTAAGTSYGEEVSFTTAAASSPGGQPCVGAATVTDYEGNVYSTVQLGQQCWMAENLRTTHYSDGTTISPGDGWSTILAYYYIPDCPLEYGYLYNWKAVMHNSPSSSANPSGVQGVCPTGWHVPSDAEWTELEVYLGGQSQYLCNNDSTFIAKALSSTSGWQSYSETCAVGDDQSSNNAAGFGALPANIYPNSSYSLPGSIAAFWSATEFVDETAWHHSLHYNSAFVSRSGTIQYYGCSVRCLRD